MISIGRFSLLAPMQPKNEIINAIVPMAINRSGAIGNALPKY